jgi:hypothetical protein
VAELKVTSIDEIKNKAGGAIVELPGWDDKPFVARLRRLSILQVASAKDFPNELLGSVEKLMRAGSKPDQLPADEMGRLLAFIAEKCLVEPAYKDVKDMLTDEQLSAIFTYAQAGVRALATFRGYGSTPKSGPGSKNV